MTMRARPSCLLLWLATLWLWASPAIPESATVDVALALAVDVSYSVDEHEHLLQMRGFAQALQSDEVLQAIHSGRHGRVAVAVYQWSDEDKQVTVIPWTIISTSADAEAVAAILAKAERKAGHGGTAISAALAYGANLLDAAPPADRRVIDLATDGRNNLGRPTRQARDAVLAKGITINGLAIRNEWKQLATYLESQVIGGSLSFVEEAASYDDFGAAMLRKLVREISGPGVT
jgi:Protein of unknown function (DUF1194)